MKTKWNYGLAGLLLLLLPGVLRAQEGMVLIRGGSFFMGSPASEARRYDTEGPQRQVRVSDFYIGKYEVTQKEWVSVIGSNPSYFQGDELPVEQVSWYEIIEYCNMRSIREGLTPAYTIDKGRSDPNNSNSNDKVKWMVTWNRRANGYRLPTEAEWEYACRAGSTGPFSTGNNIATRQANYNGNYPYNGNLRGEYRSKTRDVGSGAANTWGLYDMHGNVWEWCWDWYGAYGSGAQTDPPGAVSGSGRVLRGGSWSSGAQLLRSAFRTSGIPAHRINGHGFRLARSAGS
jgi:formylglycine-generating enzyme required for sulfatase activity